MAPKILLSCRTRGMASFSSSPPPFRVPCANRGSCSNEALSSRAGSQCSVALVNDTHHSTNTISERMTDLARSFYVRLQLIDSSLFALFHANNRTAHTYQHETFRPSQQCFITASPTTPPRPRFTAAAINTSNSLPPWGTCRQDVVRKSSRRSAPMNLSSISLTLLTS